MHVPVRLASAAVGFAVLAGLTCSFPTDKSDQVHVLVTPSDSLLVRGVIQRGSLDTLHARAFRISAAGDTIDIPNVGFSWESSDKNLARVEGVAGGAAEVTGVNAGYVDITARAIPFDKAAPGTETVRVASSFVIDSIRPTSIAYGGKVTFYGVGINQIAFAELGFSDLIPDFFSITGKPDGVGTYSFWVPPPSSSGFPFIIGPGIFGTAGDSITVGTEDIFEPDTSNVAVIDINGLGGPRLFAGLPTLYFNPALYFEPAGFGGGTDWYEFQRADTTHPVTYILGSNSFSDTAFTFLSDSIEWLGYYSLPSTSWLILPGSEYVCGGEFFFPGGQLSPTATFALRSLPSTKVQMLSFYSTAGGHSLIAVRGYVTADKRIQPDRFEEDELWCKFSDSTFTQSKDSTSPSAKHIVVGLPAFFNENGAFGDSTLTIDNPGDLDMIRFRVQPDVFGSDTMVTISVKARPFTGVDPSDIDIYVMRQSDFAYMGASTNVGSNETITTHLAPGDYYLAIVDMVQQPTRYSVCIAKGFAGITCSPPGSAPAAAPSAAVLQRPARTPHDPTVPPPDLKVKLPFGPR
jgi:hypothetical protein